MKLFQSDPRQNRTLGAVFAITFIITTLLTAFFETQVVSGKQYAARSEENRLRPIKIPAPRGTIYDREGDVVATSITGYSVSLLPASKETIRQTLQDLAPFLGLAQPDIEELMAKRNGRPNDLLTISESATFPQVAALEERRASFPNLMIVERPRRYYPAGSAVGNIVGYVSEITKDELAKPQYAGYEQGQWIGKAGIEKQYEDILGGEDGARFVEVDAMGRVVNPRASVGALAPRPGKDVKVTLDVALQKYIQQIFPDTLQGAVVAMVPSTGEVLAMYSNPSYDPNDFVGGIKGTLWTALRSDSAKPLLDRTINALYPPGSTWKLATAAEGLRRKLITKDSHFPIPCTGGMAYAGRYARCWDHSGHGYLDLAGSIEKSCDVYYYQLGIKMGLQALSGAGTRMGFNSKSGIDLPGERRPEFPPANGLVAWWKKRFGNAPMPSEIMPLAIGQGPNSQSVIKMAEFYSALAGNGTTVAPHLVVPDSALPVTLDLQLTPQDLAALWEGLARVTEAQGTALQSSLARYKLMGKTGTAQNSHGADHGWFAGFAGLPGHTPDVVVVAIVEHGLHGDATAPLAAKVANFYLDRKYHHPFDPRPTLGERWRAGIMPAGGEYDPAGRRLIPPGVQVASTAPAKGTGGAR